MRLKELVLFVVLLTGCGALMPTIKSLLEVVGPMAVDALAKEVLTRWGEDGVIDQETAGCFPVLGLEAVRDFMGDDDEEFVYIVCRAKVR